MKLISLAILAIGAALYALNSQAIEGGQDVLDNNPIKQSVVGVWNAPGQAWCTGSIVAPNTILTAAHCVSEQTVQDTFIGFGVNLYGITPSKTEGVEVRWASGFEIFPNYNANGTKDRGDIALIHFSGKIPSGYKPATFLADPSLLVNNAKIVLAGYGVTNDFTDQINGILRSTVVTVANQKWSSTEVSLDQSLGHGACWGDSGGPAYILKNGIYYLWGVTCDGDGIHSPKFPCSQRSIYTDALPYKDWITTNSI